MLKVLIIDKSEKNSLIIAKKIAALYNDLSIITISDIDNAMELIKSEKPQVVVVSLEMKDAKGRDLLERLVRWDFKILIYQDEELYEIINKTSQSQGYVFEKVN